MIFDRNKNFPGMIMAPNEAFWSEASVGYHLQFSSPQNMITNYAKYLPDLRKILRLQDSLLEYVSFIIYYINFSYRFTFFQICSQYSDGSKN